ncbi:citrate lyase holo-[acyl-carrier protein] synthase [Entomohabitans teleogrylli]|uniref:citrate lyase holo-[acyl-carrier protein] synthase n=1 Tax=Entomohabitans teleogrylli TaxID=1384589 RepID=UPI00073D6582|nr:citrate lyase holo-[acyl-carrier protein] synthase [Entomohabitans teleogrylli]
MADVSTAQPQGRAVTLQEMLRARERRVARQHHALQCYRLPLISLSLVTPGPVKDSAVYRRLMGYGIGAITHCCRQMGWTTVWEEAFYADSGSEWMCALCAPAKAIKQQMAALEDHHFLGRLWDIDVVDIDGAGVSRRCLGHSPRRCLICQDEAHACARSQRHKLSLLLDEIAGRINQYERNLCNQEPVQNTSFTERE